MPTRHQQVSVAFDRVQALWERLLLLLLLMLLLLGALVALLFGFYTLEQVSIIPIHRLAPFHALGVGATGFRDNHCKVCVCSHSLGARFCKKELGGNFPKYFLHLTQSSHVLDGHPHFAPPCSGSWHR